MHADLLTSRGMPALHTIAGLQADNSLRRETEFTVHVHEGCRHHILPVEGCAHALDVRRHTASTSGKRIVKLSRAAARQSCDIMAATKAVDTRDEAAAPAGGHV